MLLHSRRPLMTLQSHLTSYRLSHLSHQSSPFFSPLRQSLKHNSQCRHSNNIKASIRFSNSTAFSSASRPLSSKVSSSLSVINVRSIHTTPQRYNPLVSIVLRNIAKVASVFFGRAIRKWWKNRTPEQQARLKSFFRRHRWKFFAPLMAGLFASLVYYYSNIQETPITKRRRFVAFTKEQFKVINKIEMEANIQMYQDKLLPRDHPLTARVGAVVKELLVKNSDIDTIAENDWSVSVIQDDNNINAFVLPSGQIFVFSGLLKICDNDHQLGIVLAHEISHAILLHGIEMMSHAQLVDIIFIALIGALWMFLPTDFLAIAMTAFSRLVLKIGLDAPYSRMLETEADEVGLKLAAKACIDIREASIFWEKMSMIEQEVSGIPQLDVDVEFLMTHPTHERRADNLNSMMEEVLKIRECSKCNPLPKLDPKLRLEEEKKKIAAMIKEKSYEGVLKIGDL